MTNTHSDKNAYNFRKLKPCCMHTVSLLKSIFSVSSTYLVLPLEKENLLGKLKHVGQEVHK